MFSNLKMWFFNTSEFTFCVCQIPICWLPTQLPGFLFLCLWLCEGKPSCVFEGLRRTYRWVQEHEKGFFSNAKRNSFHTVYIFSTQPACGLFVTLKEDGLLGKTRGHLPKAVALGIQSKSVLNLIQKQHFQHFNRKVQVMLFSSVSRSPKVILCAYNYKYWELEKCWIWIFRFSNVVCRRSESQVQVMCAVRRFFKLHLQFDFRILCVSEQGP